MYLGLRITLYTVGYGLDEVENEQLMGLYLGNIDHRMQRFSNKYLDLQSKSAYIAKSLTKIGQASMNQALMVVATKSCSLLFDLYPRIICEAIINGCSHQRKRVINLSTLGFTFQTCLKNPIPCIPSPKTSSCVKFSVGGQFWFLQTISASVNS
ncbi:hypothetical protein IGI04_019345 [Brassica rapa subsp. trilocularis]|uniref:Uncharacterized protein n=1 Tax=Brassica rapa subsp. trilocularis TaxID=1813537 RepID=A0ABQ7MFJ6_BRACM|nr:hypothetical protein IGI04_019345 [Brassica rapa subsp. trilocularis]